MIFHLYHSLVKFDALVYVIFTNADEIDVLAGSKQNLDTIFAGIGSDIDTH